MKEDRELPPVNLREYAQKIRNTFNIVDVPDDTIDYKTIQALPTEIERRRKLLEYFIPDIFAPGKYDRRADVIDGCIYYLEYKEKGRYKKTIFRLWCERTGVKFPGGMHRDKDLETSSYGTAFYHPITSIIVDEKRPERYLPKLIQYLLPFKGRKRKLDLFDFNLIFKSIFYQPPTITLNEELLFILKQFENTIQKRPLIEGIQLKDFIKLTIQKLPAFTNNKIPDWKVQKLYTELNKISLRVKPLFEKSIFGLRGYLFICNYPHHVRVTFRHAQVSQELMSTSEDIIQQIYTIIPDGAAWEFLYRKFPPNTECFRFFHLPVPRQSLFKFYDLHQGWKIPWNNFSQKWQDYADQIESYKTDKIPIRYPYSPIKPSEQFLKLCFLLESNGNYRNDWLSRQTGIPKDEIPLLRKEIDNRVMVNRYLFYIQENLSEWISLDLPGNETWKYRFLFKIAECAPIAIITYYEDLFKSKNFFRAAYIFTPEDSQRFIRIFVRIFNEKFPFHIQRQLNTLRLTRSWFDDFFDKNSQKFRWSPSDYKITPLHLQ